VERARWVATCDPPLHWHLVRGEAAESSYTSGNNDQAAPEIALLSRFKDARDIAHALQSNAGTIATTRNGASDHWTSR